MNLKSLISFHLTLWLAGFSFAGDIDSWVLAKNEFSIRRSFHCFFDQAPICQTPSAKIPYGSFMNSAGIGFRRQIFKTHFIGVTSDFYRYYNCGYLPGMPNGSTLHRTFIDIRLEYSNDLDITETPMLLDIGISYRSGSETFLEDYEELQGGGHITYVERHDLKNMGVSTGLTATYWDWGWMRLQVQLKLTNYFYWPERASAAYSSKTKPTTSMVNFGLIAGIGK